MSTASKWILSSQYIQSLVELLTLINYSQVMVSKKRKMIKKTDNIKKLDFQKLLSRAVKSPK